MSLATFQPVPAVRSTTDDNGLTDLLGARDRPLVEPIPRLFTAADLAELPAELPSGPVLWELDNGRLIAMAPPGDTHGSVDARLVGRLLYEGEFKGHGKARGEVGIVLWRQPADRVVGADGAFIANRSLPIRLSKEGYLETIPDLIVEVRSKNDTGPSIEQKVKDYLLAGVRVVWVADPDKWTITEYRPDQKERLWTESDTLTVEEIIPGLAIPVGQVFQE